MAEEAADTAAQSSENPERPRLRVVGSFAAEAPAAAANDALPSNTVTIEQLTENTLRNLRTSLEGRIPENAMKDAALKEQTLKDIELAVQAVGISLKPSLEALKENGGNVFTGAFTLALHIYNELATEVPNWKNLPGMLERGAITPKVYAMPNVKKAPEPYRPGENPEQRPTEEAAQTPGHSAERLTHSTLQNLRVALQDRVPEGSTEDVLKAVGTALQPAIEEAEKNKTTIPLTHASTLAQALYNAIATEGKDWKGAIEFPRLEPGISGLVLWGGKASLPEGGFAGRTQDYVRALAYMNGAEYNKPVLGDLVRASAKIGDPSLGKEIREAYDALIKDASTVEARINVTGQFNERLKTYRNKLEGMAKCFQDNGREISEAVGKFSNDLTTALAAAEHFRGGDQARLYMSSLSREYKSVLDGLKSEAERDTFHYLAHGAAQSLLKTSPESSRSWEKYGEALQNPDIRKMLTSTRLETYGGISPTGKMAAEPAKRSYPGVGDLLEKHSGKAAIAAGALTLGASFFAANENKPPKEGEEPQKTGGMWQTVVTVGVILTGGLVASYLWPEARRDLVKRVVNGFGPAR